MPFCINLIFLPSRLLYLRSLSCKPICDIIRKKNIIRLKEDLKLRYFEAPDLVGLGKNAYRFVNAVSDFATHAEPLRRTANYKENMFSKTVEGNPLIDKAYQMIVA